jgi:hypothetical protein
MPQPLPPILMLYDPVEFWEEVRSAVRSEVADAQTGTAAVASALLRAGLPVKPAYTPADIRRLFEISEIEFDEWTAAGFLRPARIGRQIYILYPDLPPLFAARPDSTTQPFMK